MVTLAFRTRLKDGRTDGNAGVTRGPLNMMYRNFLVYRRIWLVIATGFFEPVLYLFSMGVGVGKLIDGFEYNGHVVEYAAFVAPRCWQRQR